MEAAMKWVIPLLILVALSGCKSDAEKCVDAVMVSHDGDYPEATKASRDFVKAQAHIKSQGKN
jgi:hypothetical protein